ncbi:hypothetical protein SGFS_046330 [Streptomyces graminofaciens]|uniref:Tyr recombinase domain-containing protein n=1 Tax=Streptomyces graminofaciens TaxID=68212 RepID=A0ABM8HKU1_9ACTN|nr:hypothetical protein SGFS_046330 [Streptomyces graminofaciens]
MGGGSAVAARQDHGSPTDTDVHTHPPDPQHRPVVEGPARSSRAPGLRVIRLHDARHGTATLLTTAGVAPRVVMEILGRSQISITMDVYARVVQDTRRETVSHMDRLFKRRLV